MGIVLTQLGNIETATVNGSDFSQKFRTGALFVLSIFILIVALPIAYASAQSIQVDGNSTPITHPNLVPSIANDTDFGAVGAGITKNTTYYVINTGLATDPDLTVSNFSISGTHASDFTFNSTNLLPANSSIPGDNNSINFTVDFAPSAPGLRSATVTFDYNDGTDKTFSFNVQGTGTAAPASFVISSGDNQSTAISTAFTSPLVARVLDGSNNPIPGVSISFSPPDQGSGPVTGATLSQTTIITDANGEASVTATANGLIGAYQIRSTLTGFGEVFFDLTNLDAGPEVEVSGNSTIIVTPDGSPSTTDGTDFGTTMVGSPDTATFTFTNRGSSALTLNSPSITGNPGEFVVTTPPATSVPAGGQTQMVITFTPTVPFFRTANFTLISNDLDDNETTISFAIQGTGTSVVDSTAPRITSILRQTPNTQNTSADSLTWRVTFDKPVQNVNGGAGGDFTVAGVTAGTIGVSAVSTTVYDVTISGGDLAGLNGAVNFSLSSASQNITDLASTPNALSNFTPTGANDNDFNVSNAALVPDIAVTGNGIEIFNNDVTPQSADFTDFGSHDVSGGQQPQTLVVSSVGTAQLDLNTGNLPILITGTHAQDFSVSAQPSQFISAGSFSNFTILFNPSELGLRTATVSIPSNDPDEDPFTFSIQGTGVDATAPRILSIDNLFASQQTDNDEIIWRVMFNEVVENVSIDDFTISGTTAVLSVRTPPTNNPGFGTLFDMRLSGGDLADLNGNVTLALSGSHNIVDSASNALANPAPSGSPDDRVVQITNLDPDLKITGDGLIGNASGSGPEITNGQTTISVAGGTDLGSVAIGSFSLRYQFSFGNTVTFSTLTTGPNALTFSGPAAGDFSVVGASNRSLGGNSTTGFDITFRPTAIGQRDATVTLVSNDPDENPFVFNISGTGLAGPANAIVLTSGGAQSQTVNTAFAAPIVATVTDAGGNPISGATVNFAAPNSGASSTLSASSAVTDVSGQVSVTPTANAIAGNYDITISSAGLTNVTASLTNIAGAPATLNVVSGSPQTAPLNTGFADALVARVIDAGGNPVSGVTVNFAAPVAGASAALSAPSAVTDSTGQASITAIANGTDGTYNIITSSAGLANVTFDLTNRLGPTVEETQAVIADFMLNRANHILNNQPDMISFLDGANTTGGGPLGNLGLEGNSEGLTLAFSTSRSKIKASEAEKRIALAFDAEHPNEALAHQQFGYGAKDVEIGKAGSYDVWTQIFGSNADSKSADSRLWVGYLGAHYFTTDENLIGIMGQIDWANETNTSKNSKADGVGWMVGPYVAGRIKNSNLSYELKAAWGRSQNDVSPDGTFTDQFKTERRLLKAKLMGSHKINEFTFKPEVSASWFEEVQEAYTDTIMQYIPKQTISLGEVRFGSNISKDIKTENGSLVTPSIGLSGIWNFDVGGNPEQTVSQGFALAQDDLRARIDAGISSTNSQGLTFKLEGYYDGIGVSNYSAQGVNVKIVVPLN